MLLHMPAIKHQLLTRTEAAEALRYSTRKIDYLIAEGDLPAVRIGRSVRITEAALERFIKARESRTKVIIRKSKTKPEPAKA